MINGFMQNISGFGRVGFQVTGTDELKKVIGQAILINKNAGAILRMIGMRMKKMIQDNIKRQENADGSKWEPMSEVTKELRRKGRGTGEPILLRDTGRLFNSIAFKVNGNEIIAGTNVEYAPALQFGQKGGWSGGNVEGKWIGETMATIPARQFVYIRDADIEILTKMLTNELIIAAFRKR
jgi:phage virion morphogenesis protein